MTPRSNEASRVVETAVGERWIGAEPSTVATARQGQAFDVDTVFWSSGTDMGVEAE